MNCAEKLLEPTIYNQNEMSMHVKNWKKKLARTLVWIYWAK